MGVQIPPSAPVSFQQLRHDSHVCFRCRQSPRRHRAVIQVVNPHVVIVPDPRAVAQLMSCLFLAFYDREAMARTLAAADRVVSATACFDLRFAPDPSVIDMVEAVMA